MCDTTTQHLSISVFNRAHKWHCHLDNDCLAVFFYNTCSVAPTGLHHLIYPITITRKKITNCSFESSHAMRRITEYIVALTHASLGPDLLSLIQSPYHTINLIKAFRYKQLKKIMSINWQYDFCKTLTVRRDEKIVDFSFLISVRYQFVC